MSTQSPCEVLRAAAARIREVASKANGGTWWADGTEIYSHEEPNWVGETLDLKDAELGEANAAHMVLWQPTVALLVASILDDHAEEWADHSETEQLFVAAPNGDDPATASPVYLLARAINGGQS